MYYLIIKELLIYFPHIFKERCLNSGIKKTSISKFEMISLKVCSFTLCKSIIVMFPNI